nr:MAG TPA: hypothetical protein [Caudoviricetes sp.]
MYPPFKLFHLLSLINQPFSPRGRASMGMYNDPEYFEKRARYQRRVIKKIVSLILSVFRVK